MKTLLGWFWQGCLVLVPLVATFYVGYLVVATFDRLIPVGFPGLGLVAAVTLATLAGFLTSNVLGRAVVRWAERGLTALPFVRLVYTSIRDLVQAFVGDQKGFDRPVLVEPLPGGARVLGFLTRERLAPLGVPDHVAVYIPQSYNFAGNLVIVPHHQVQELDVASPEVLAFIVSGGVSGLGVESPISTVQPAG
jgi:uncharacterized membrane protein